MRSRSDDELLDLDHGIPTTPRDVEALRRARPGGMPFDEYLKFLSDKSLTYEQLRARRGPRGTPFRL